MKLVGIIYYDEEITEIYSDNNKDFFLKDNNKVDQSDLEYWAVLINSTWGVDTEYYKIISAIDRYTFDKELEYKCEYYTDVYDDISALICNYGKTVEEAFENCLKFKKYIISTYNKENKSV